MKPRDLVLEQIHHRRTQPVPFTLLMEDDVAERLDAHYGGPDWRRRLTPYTVNVAVVDTDGKVAISESLARDPFGTIWRTDLRPTHLEQPPLPEPSLKDYNFPGLDQFLLGEKDRQAARQTCRQCKDSFLIGSIGSGLFERSWKIRGFENALMDVIAEPDFYAELLDRLTGLCLEYVAETVKLPVDAIMFGDDWGDQRGVIIGPDRWRKFIKPRWARLYQAGHDAGKLVISHCCGSVADIMPDIVEIGLDVLESCQPEAMDIYELKRRYGEKITFWGGLGSQSTIPFGTPQGIRQEVRRLCVEMGRGGGYILAPAKPLQPETPTENAAAVLEAFANQDA